MAIAMDIQSKNRYKKLSNDYHKLLKVTNHGFFIKNVRINIFKQFG